MKHFAYESAQSVEQASELLRKGDAVLSAGGTDLTGVLKEKLLPNYPRTVVSLKEIPGMNRIAEEADGLHLGAMATLADIASSGVVRSKWPALADAAYSVATPNLRNTATVGGNICQDVRCWYYRYPDSIGGRVNCARKDGHDGRKPVSFHLRRDEGVPDTVLSRLSGQYRHPRLYGKNPRGGYARCG